MTKKKLDIMMTEMTEIKKDHEGKVSCWNYYKGTQGD